MLRALATYASTATRDDAEVLLQRHSALIDRCARRLVTRTGLSSGYDDLWSVGALALIEASARYDASRGASFETFAGHRIRGAMLDELRKLDHLPRRLRSRTDDVVRAREKLTQRLGREATSAELAQELDVDLEELSGIEALTAAPLPLDHILPTLVAEGSVDDDLDRAQAVAALAAAISTLPDRLQILIALHYQEGLSYREISKILDVSEPRVCQLHGDAIRHLRTALEEAADSKPRSRP